MFISKLFFTIGALTLHLIPIFFIAIYKLTFIILIMLPQYTFAFACAYNFSQEILINGCLTHADFWQISEVNISPLHMFKTIPPELKTLPHTIILIPNYAISYMFF